MLESMRKSILPSVFMALVAAYAPAASAYGPVVPPAGLTEEPWLLFHDNYKFLAYGEPRYRYHDLIQDVALARDGDDVYIKGIFREYPDAWVKGTFKKGELRLADSQLMAESDGEPVYFRCGTAAFESRETDVSDFLLARFSMSYYPVKFAVSDDGATMVSTVREGIPSFWYCADRTGSITLRDGNVNGETVEYPDEGYMLYMCLKKAGVSGVSGITGEDGDGASEPMYDLQGREVNPETAGPGIYIRDGRKIMVR